MLPQAPVPCGPRSWSRGSLACVGGLLTLVVFVFGVAFAAPAPPQKEENKSTESKKDKSGKDDPKKEQADKEDSKKSDADKEIDELVKEMKRGSPPGTTEQQLREQVRRMPAERRKYMLQNLKQSRNQRGFFPPKPPIGGGAMPGMFGMFGQNARLGARVEAVSATLAEQLDLPKGRGLVVQEVVADSAAAKAGIKAHDVLLEFNGKAVPNRVDEFTRQLADIKPDAAVEVVVMRKGKKETIKDVKLPEAKAGMPGFPPGVFPGAGVPGGGFPQGVPGGGGFPQAGGGFQLPQGFGVGAAVVTTLTRRENHFTLRHEEGSLIITLTGRIADGKPKVGEINVQDGLQAVRYESVDKVPERYQDKVKNLIEMSEKGSVRIEIKSK